MAEADQAREMWRFEDEEPEREMWEPISSGRLFWKRAASPHRSCEMEGEGVFATREAAIRHAIEEAKRDQAVMEKAAAEFEEKIRRLTGMLEEEG